MRRRRFLKTGGLAALLAAMPRAFARAVGYPRALQGPMAGAPGPNNFKIWTRARGLFDVTMEYSTDIDFATVHKRPTATDRKSGVTGTSWYCRIELVGARFIIKTKQKQNIQK